ncbi:MAG: hypothetical protein RLN85_00485, partial [Pseudomonadales bacterium]
LDGNVDLGYIVNAITSESGRYLALRKSAECAPRVLKDTAGLVLHSGLANGKTVALQEIASHLLLLDRSVYVLDDEDGNYESDIEKLSELKEIAYLIVDDCERYSDLIKYFLSVLGPRGRVVASERSHRLAKGIEPFDALDLQIAINSVDYLEETERTGLIKVLDTAGLWGTLAGKSRKAKEDYIEVTCESQISAILLDILEAPQIKNVVLSEFQKVSKDERVKRTIYTICIIQSVGAGKVTKSLISEVEDSLDVYSKEVSDALAGSGMFGRSDGNTLETRSSIFGTFLMREAFTPSYAVSRLVEVARRYRFTAPSDYAQFEIRRATMRFSYLSLVLPLTSRKTSYVQFYDQLKEAVPNLAYHPHYWLQYSMAVMSYGDLNTAQRFLEQSYGTAERMSGYDTTYIDNQQAKLHLLHAIQETDPAQSFELFSVAEKLLNSGKVDDYKFRQANFYIEFYESRFNSLSKKHRHHFMLAMKNIVNEFDSFLANKFKGGALPLHFEKQRIGFYDVVSQIEGAGK